jgi:hypothetical protein
MRLGAVRAEIWSAAPDHRAQGVIRVAGELSDSLLTALLPLSVQRRPAQTELYGDLPDQAALLSVVSRLDELGVRILELAEVPTTAAGRPHLPP